MTDSMKFGPEWLRNMSADCMNLGSTNFTNSSTPKNMFPEFRYGREEMLSLFDKNCTVPEILPTFKKLFVEKVQYPLALTPSNEDETLTQSSPIPSQRPTWLQRSPVGFGTSARGTGRGGSVDRGRIRGKSVYHSIFQRPTSTFDDDLRAGSLKNERGWSERNGAGDTANVTSSGLGSDWSSTPSTSPRKEFSSHTRNLENWRKNRSEDGSGDTSSNNANVEGWRGPSGNSFGNSHRWGRSTSWRDDDSSNTNTETCYSGVNMQRSHSTIATLVSERNQVNRLYTSNINSHNSRNSQWSGTGNGIRSAEGDDHLPEWAMENPSDIGGTFDASGAFHGSVDKNDNSTVLNEVEKSQSENNQKTENCGHLAINENSITEEKKKLTSTFSVDLDHGENSVVQNNVASKINAEERRVCDEVDVEDVLESEILKQENQIVSQVALSQVKTVSENESPTCAFTTISGNAVLCERETDSQLKHTMLSQSDCVVMDFSDRMKEVADDMVEKLIKDDDPISTSKNPSCVTPKSGAKLNDSTIGLQNSYMSATVGSLLKQTSQPSHQPTSLSPTLPSMTTNNKSGTMFVSGIVENQPNQLQSHQHPIVAGSGQSAVGPHTELWYYRDPQSKVQGPFTAIEMTEWYRAGYFNENLFVRRSCDSHFRALGELIKICHGNMPFTHSHLIDMGLEDQREGLKSDVTAAADSISSAVKNAINSVDLTHMLNMHFQVLQEQYIRHQEIIILGELSKNECFQRLNPEEQESIVRQKVQMFGLPEYLTSLTGLTNSLAALNPSAGNQLYEVIAECSKKDQVFSRGPQHSCEQNVANVFIDSNDYILGSKQQRQQQSPQSQYQSAHFTSILGVNNDNNSCRKLNNRTEELSRNELLDEFNLHMYLRSGSVSEHQNLIQKSPHFLSNANNNDFLPDPHILTTSGSQSPMIHMWIPQVVIPSNSPQPSLQQHIHQQNQWVGNPLVGIPSTVISGQQIGINNIQQSTSMPSSMWDVPTLKQSENNVSDEDLNNVQDHIVQHGQMRRHTEQKELKIDDIKSKDMLHQKLNVAQERIDSTIPIPQANIISQQRKDASNEKNLVNKRSKNLSFPLKIKDDTANLRKNDEDRRRELADEKRKQKEEKKRLQIEEEKRRMQQLEDEKKRQILEERERQLQIQTQRRKALLGSENSLNSGNSLISSTHVIKQSKDQRVPFSVAPWSTQISSAAAKDGPCLAEIQKAERRERRADQQRQTEMLEKQIRSNTAVTEGNEGALKWNASQVPVKSIAEIQAEEAKRLVSDQIEVQRRKEQEHQLSINSTNTTIINANSSSTLSNNVTGMWNANKVWGSSAATVGFWDDSIKFISASPVNSLISTTSTNATVNSGNCNNQCQLTPNAKSSNSGQTVLRNLKKSQTISVMQNTTVKKGNASNNLQSNSIVKQVNKTLSKGDADAKKTSFKNQNHNVGTSSSISIINKRDEFENEFTSWCTKSLNNMNTKIDVPTFVTFLQDLESPYEVKDYIRMYLGESKEYVDFAKQFLERRSKYKNLQRAQNAHNDDMCKPAPAITPSGNENSDHKGKQKKLKKNKMTKLDARILGFSVTAAEGRINVGDRDYVDAL